MKIWFFGGFWWFRYLLGNGEPKSVQNTSYGEAETRANFLKSKGFTVLCLVGAGICIWIFI